MKIMKIPKHQIINKLKFQNSKQTKMLWPKITVGLDFA